MDIDIIDDDNDLRELYQEIIETGGFNAKGYACAEDYIKSQKCTSSSIAVITDVCMPGKSGYELINEVKKNNPKQRFVVITGTPQKGYIKEARACFYVQKPVKMDKLIDVITLLSLCSLAGNSDLPPACKLISDLDSFGICDWKCPHQN